MMMYHYLNYALNLLYYPEETVNINNHTTQAIKNNSKIIVPFRNPIDCISSWNLYQEFDDKSLEKDIKFYNRFYTFVIENLNKCVLLDFSKITNDIEYIKTKIYFNFLIESKNIITSEDVKNKMQQDEHYDNLPRNDKDKLDAIKLELKNNFDLNNSINLYEILLNLE